MSTLRRLLSAPLVLLASAALRLAEEADPIEDSPAPEPEPADEPTPTFPHFVPVYIGQKESAS